MGFDGVDLTVCGLAIARGGVPILSDLSFDLSPGKALILRGPNGAGKTTLLRTLAGIQKPLGGTITGAEDRIAYAGHADGLKAMLSVTENLKFWAEVFGAVGIDGALEAYRLHSLSDRLAGTLSAGQKRRLGLARLIVTGRPVWVLDEPTVSLDADAVLLFAEAVRAHLARGGMALMATHIELGIAADVLDVSDFRVRAGEHVGASDEAFL